MTAVSYGTEGSGVASAWEDEGGQRGWAEEERRVATTVISDRKLMAADIQIAHAYAGRPGRSGLAAKSEAAGRSPICPSCGHNVVQAPHRSNKGSMLICCRGWLAQMNADRAKKQS